MYELRLSHQNHSSMPSYMDSGFGDFDIVRQERSGSVGSWARCECRQRAERTATFAVVVIACTANASGAKSVTIAYCATATIQKFGLAALLQSPARLQHFLHHRFRRFGRGHAGAGTGHGIQVGNILVAVDFRASSWRRATNHRNMSLSVQLIVAATATDSAIHHHQRRRRR